MRLRYKTHISERMVWGEGKRQNVLYDWKEWVLFKVKIFGVDLEIQKNKK